MEDEIKIGDIVTMISQTLTSDRANGVGLPIKDCLEIGQPGRVDATVQLPSGKRAFRIGENFYHEGDFELLTKLINAQNVLNDYDADDLVDEEVCEDDDDDEYFFTHYPEDYELDDDAFEGLEDDITFVEDIKPEYIITNDSIALTMEGVTHSINADDSNYEAIRELILDGEYAQAMAALCPADGIELWGEGLLSIKDGEVCYDYNGTAMRMTGKLVDRILGLMAEGDNSFERLARFLNLTMEQESFKTRERLMDFAAHDKLDITDEGYVIAFKNVGNDFYDKHSRKFKNEVGDSPSMPRAMVNDDHNVSCAAGLHVASPTYLKSFWGNEGHTMKVVVDPRDFVAIPYDYNDSKARVSKYLVVAEVSKEDLEGYGLA